MATPFYYYLAHFICLRAKAADQQLTAMEQRLESSDRKLLVGHASCTRITQWLMCPQDLTSQFETMSDYEEIKRELTVFKSIEVGVLPVLGYELLSTPPL